MHDTIGCYLDLDKGHISFAKNGVVLLITTPMALVIYNVYLIKLFLR